MNTPTPCSQSPRIIAIGALVLVLLAMVWIGHRRSDTGFTPHRGNALNGMAYSR